MKRINLLHCQITNNKTSNNQKNKSLYLYGEISNPMEIHLNSEETNYLNMLREFLKINLSPKNTYKYFENEEFPKMLVDSLVDKFPEIFNQTIGVSDKSLKTISDNLSKAILIEVGKFDLNLLTFIGVHGRLCIDVINSTGSDNHKKEFIPKLANLQKIGSFCLTEEKIGSEAHEISTNYNETSDSFILNGDKRWIGNANFDNSLLIIIARDIKNDKNFKGFLVDANTLGINVEKIKGKLSMRMVQNCCIDIKNVVVKKDRVLPGINKFEDVSNLLQKSRLVLCYGMIGGVIGSFNVALNHCQNRIQFKKPLVRKQNIQMQLFEIRSNIEAMFALVERLSYLCNIEDYSSGKVGMAKAWCSNIGKKSISIAREILGGNGILYENLIMKHMLDFESMVTYEGTTQINSLAVGKEIIGSSTFY